MRPTPLRARSRARPHIALARVPRAFHALAGLALRAALAPSALALLALARRVVMPTALALLAVTVQCAIARADPAPRATAAAVESAAPLKIDGALDEPAWRSAPEIAAFQLMAPREGQAPDESTSVRVLVDGDRVVFGIWCEARRPLRASLAPRDEITDGDHIAVHLDPEGDGQRAYIFGINPYSVELDGILTEDPDFKWDAVWDGAARVEDGAWTAEIAVPFKVMRFPPHGARPWRVWIRREITAWNEVAVWPLYRFSEAGRIMLQAADLTGLESVSGGRDVRVEPYVFGSAEGARDYVQPGGFTPWSDDRHREAGLDLQTALTSALALNATWNPDFSQIEADALQIDLNQRFPLQYPEKRPFFLEGGEAFATPLEMVYTRRMSDPDAGLKLTGRVGPANTGVLVLRDRGGASLAGSGQGYDGLSWPGAFALARAQVPFGNGSSVGVLLGGHSQGAWNDPASPSTDSTSRNGLAALDAQWRISNRWTAVGQLGLTETKFHHGYDAATSRADESRHGAIGLAGADYSDRGLKVHVAHRHVSPDYRDELGYQERVGVEYDELNGGWDLYPKAGALQSVTPYSDNLVVHDHTGRIEYVDLNPYVVFQFRRNLWATPGWHAYQEHWLGRTYRYSRAHVSLGDTEWRPLAISVETQFGQGLFYGATDAESFVGWTDIDQLTLTARPSERLTSAIDVQHLRVARHATSGQVLDVWVTGVNTTMQFTRSLYARVYPQFDGEIEHLNADALVGYVVHPGTVLYVGVNSGFDRLDHRQRPTRRQVFVKASYRLGI